MLKYIAFIFFLICCFYFYSFEFRKDNISLSPQELHSLLANNDIQLIDVREPVEFNDGFIPSAILIPVYSLSNKLDLVSKDKQIVVYCHSGSRSMYALKLLKDNGFNNVSHLSGGIVAWNSIFK